MPDEYLKIHAQPRLSSDLVIGHIRWSRAQGRPEGNMAGGFALQAYHYDMVYLGHYKDLPRHVRRPHLIDAWEGPHDDTCYRVSFMTDAIEPTGYDPDDKDVLRTCNFLEIGFNEQAAWTAGAAGGRAFLLPTQIVFDPPGRIQLLPDIRIFETTASIGP